LSELLRPSAEIAFYSFDAVSLTSSLIPLSIAVNKLNGGVSVEHSHPPQEYFMADRKVVNELKASAAKYLFGASGC
jgi:hypothetical protein